MAKLAESNKAGPRLSRPTHQLTLQIRGRNYKHCLSGSKHYLNTAQYEDLQLFRNVLDANGTNEFQAFYETVGIRTLGGEAEFDLGTLWKFQGGIEFYGYNMAESSEDERPWNMPTNRWNASATYQVIDGLNVSADAAGATVRRLKAFFSKCFMRVFRCFKPILK